MPLTAALHCTLILVDAWQDTARLLAPDQSRHPLRSLRRHHGALETAERRLVRQRLHGRIDQATYRSRMRSLAEGRRTPGRGRRHG
jgi:hypothetical protein